MLFLKRLSDLFDQEREQLADALKARGIEDHDITAQLRNPDKYTLRWNEKVIGIRIEYGSVNRTFNHHRGTPCSPRAEMTEILLPRLNGSTTSARCPLGARARARVMAIL
ncbi:MAG: type I restriction-modification system subunit M N-terminal domain-containing protein, partial [Beggiatoa sp.]|nr:type I restriction-modification system subunit M N-terminal domain-containing protein [Beggiatoa sp.]